MSTRRLRIVKYRGTLHGTNEYPFLITRDGISVLPITSVGLDHQAPAERVSSGIKELDEMLGGKGYYRGSSILVSGTAGSGKSSLSAAFVDAACRRRERCLYFAFEESANQILRNMRSINIDLAPHVKNGLLQFNVARPTLYGLEMHLVTMYELIGKHKPQIVILDPITDFFAIGSTAEVKAAITRIIDFLKTNQITALFTSYTEEDVPNESVVGVSSLIDTWISLRNLENNGERHRGLFILKSRGMAHSNQIRSFQITDHGIQIGALDLAGRQTELSTAKEML
jgi:circadian clock protein KaiC